MSKNWSPDDLKNKGLVMNESGHYEKATVIENGNVNIKPIRAGRKPHKEIQEEIHRDIEKALVEPYPSTGTVSGIRPQNNLSNEGLLPQTALAHTHKLTGTAEPKIALFQQTGHFFYDATPSDIQWILDLLKIKELKYIFDIAPFTAPRMSSSDRWKKRPIVTKYWKAKDQFKKLCKEADFELTPILNVAFFIEMPQTWSKKKKAEMLHKPHQQKPDKDNLEKAVMDSFSIDDSFVYDGRTCKFWNDKPMIIIF